MTSVLCGRARLVITQSSGRQALAALRVGWIRTFSAAGSDEPYFVVPRGDSDSGPRTVWPDENMGPFGPQDQRFQLPGNSGFDFHLEGMADQRMKGPVHRTVPDVLTAATSNERHEFVMAQFVSEFQVNSGPMLWRSVRKAEHYFDQPNVNCSIQTCPELLKKEFESYFPSAPASAITVVTVKHTRCEVIDKEVIDREQLLHKFVSGAKEICFALWTAGFWADFIDPSSGSAFFGSHSNHPLLKEEEWSRLGFHIEASGSCTVIRHVLRGTPTFVGTVFTTAPANSQVMERLQGQSSAFEDRD
ncbi:cobalamin trafficking protein CblD-like [Salvelinus fontinalis]|uniref:cobalamin trafficking protein CblD-like n=1 Tax=Salvelinus fontinalis TaxID=8038 RepID=UPI002484FD61|nr:cobalamin trafficking protein CblD-like [Salvelinus fontinalis]XP_055771095.1 cobalamin trafficking protein CblD-like [Salvelinus fontinalis]XP_055771262.1 cobalamin trafficking protein CblD-like [Salvelinus fontinalis]XP_055771263.1 cobalamin trafficking protein CblD-like [Salvelinus fontinalis]